MKRILILTILLMSSLAWAGSTTVVVGQGGGGAACLTDDFTGDNDTALETYSSNYKSISATLDVGSIEIYGNAAQVESTYNAAGCYYDDGTGAKSGTTYTKATISEGAYTVGLPTICTRASADNTGYGAYLYSSSGGNLTRLAVHKNGKTLGTYATVAVDADAPHTVWIKAENSGDNVIISVWIDTLDGTPDETETDSSDVIASGYSGFYWDGTSNFIWSVDDFSDCSF